VGVLLQTLVSGTAAGVVYALIALGATLLAGLVRVLPLAHGDLVAGGTGVAVVLVLGTTPVAAALGLGPALGLVVVTPAASAALSVVVYALVVRPAVRSDGPDAGSGDGAAALGWAVGAVATGLLVRAGLARAFPRDATAVPDPLRLAALAGGDVLRLPGGATVPGRLLPAIALGLLVTLAAERLLVRSRFGLAARAVSDDPVAATLVGIDISRVLVGAFAAAGLLAGAAGLLIVPDHPLTSETGVLLGLKAFAAALLGGLGSLRGAVLAGLLLGVAESAVVAVPSLGPAYAQVFALGVLVVVVALRPTGLRSADRARTMV